jgi:hypothetical protein
MPNSANLEPLIITDLALLQALAVEEIYHGTTGTTGTGLVQHSDLVRHL